MIPVAYLHREDTSDQGTRGRLVTELGHWFTLELPWRENARGRSCIPAGKYTCRSEKHARLGRVYRLEGVPGRDGVLIHSGNYAGDVEKGWASHVEGCILLGKKRGQLLDTSKRRYQEAVLVSTTALSEFGRSYGWAPFVLEVTWQP